MKARILVVEDDQIIQLDLQRHLNRLDYEVVGTASSGEEAIANAAQLQPDVVLMDIRLYGAMDGIEAAHHIQSARRVPVIYLTAQSGDVSLSGKEIPKPRVAKPFKQIELREAIEEALRREES